MLDGDVTGNEVSGDHLIGFVVGISTGSVVAICGAIVAWLKWRHTPHNK